MHEDSHTDKWQAALLVWKHSLFRSRTMPQSTIVEEKRNRSVSWETERRREDRQSIRGCWGELVRFTRRRLPEPP